MLGSGRARLSCSSPQHTLQSRMVSYSQGLTQAASSFLWALLWPGPWPHPWEEGQEPRCNPQVRAPATSSGDNTAHTAPKWGCLGKSPLFGCAIAPGSGAGWPRGAVVYAGDSRACDGHGSREGACRSSASSQLRDLPVLLHRHHRSRKVSHSDQRQGGAGRGQDTKIPPWLDEQQGTIWPSSVPGEGQGQERVAEVSDLHLPGQWQLAPPETSGFS